MSTLNSKEFAELDKIAKEHKLSAMTTFSAQILLAVQIMIKEANMNSNWLEWDVEQIIAFANNKNGSLRS